MPSAVAAIPAASPAESAQYFSGRLSFETDCADVHEALGGDMDDFVLLDVRGPTSYAKAHVPGAVNLPHRTIDEESLAPWPDEMLFVVYCAGPHCNGADRAALRLAGLGRRVKIMIGGMTGWAEEGFSFAHGPEPGRASSPEIGSAASA